MANNYTKLRATAVVTSVLIDLSGRKGFDHILDEMGYPEDCELEDELQAVVESALECFEGLR